MSMASEHLTEVDWPVGTGPAALLAEAGIDAIMVSSEADVDSVLSSHSPQIALLHSLGLGVPDVKNCLRRCVRIKLPVLLLVPELRVRDLVDSEGIDDVQCHAQLRAAYSFVQLQQFHGGYNQALLLFFQLLQFAGGWPLGTLL